jgi:hypothetical protein
MASPVDFADRLTGLAGLDEPVLRALYQYVAAQSGAVSRDEVAGGRSPPVRGHIPPRPAGRRPSTAAELCGLSGPRRPGASRDV